MTCEHTFLLQPQWALDTGSRDKVFIECHDCGATAIVDITDQLKFEWTTPPKGWLSSSGW